VSGETDLGRLLASMRPTLSDETYVFATMETPPAALIDAAIMTFKEAEGVTLILPQDVANAQRIRAVFPCRMITLNVHSSLDAVGFLARIAARLTEMGVGLNPVAGFHHDHLFIPDDRAAEALEALDALSRYMKT